MRRDGRLTVLFLDLHPAQVYTLLACTATGMAENRETLRTLVGA
jgi:hypothetical protein